MSIKAQFTKTFIKPVLGKKKNFLQLPYKAMRPFLIYVHETHSDLQVHKKALIKKKKKSLWTLTWCISTARRHNGVLDLLFSYTGLHMKEVVIPLLHDHLTVCAPHFPRGCSENIYLLIISYHA